MLKALDINGKVEEISKNDIGTHLRQGSIVFGDYSAKYQKYSRDNGLRTLSMNQMIWINNNNSDLNVHQRIDLKKLFTELP